MSPFTLVEWAFYPLISFSTFFTSPTNLLLNPISPPRRCSISPIDWFIESRITSYKLHPNDSDWYDSDSRQKYANICMLPIVGGHMPPWILGCRQKYTILICSNTIVGISMPGCSVVLLSFSCIIDKLVVGQWA